ncbi:MAG: hypothetical protein OHK0013_48550 [Sandaracinaceae bacterium]
MPRALAELDRERRARWLVAIALVVAAVARLGTVGWGLPFRFHIDEQGFVLWVAAHTEHQGFVRGSFRPTVSTYGPLVYELAIGVKWLLSDVSRAAEAARGVPDGWAYLRVLDDPAVTPLTMIEWTRAMRTVSAWCGVLTLLLLARAARRLGGPEAATLVAWLGALAPGLVQVSHFYTPDGLLLLFEAMVIDAASLLLVRPSWQRASYAGIAVGLILSTKMTGALVALLVPWALWARREGPWRGAIVRACMSRFTWTAVATSIATFVLLCPWAVREGPSYFTGASGPSSGAYMLRSLYERDFGWYDWRFTYNGQPRGLPFFTSLLPYVLGEPTVAVGLAGLFMADRRVRALAWGALLPTAIFVSGWTVLTVRYALPLAPPLLLTAASVLARLSTEGWPATTRWRVDPKLLGLAGRALVAVVLAVSLARGLAWTLMFVEDDPRALASRWIASHASDGDVVVTEADLPYTAPLGHDDEQAGAVPWAMPRLVVRRLFAHNELGAAVPQHLERVLGDARFLVVSDWMLRRGLHPEAERRAGAHARFYRALVAGTTGFSEVARFDRRPTLGPLVWDESGEEQLAVCFDHCPVRIYERTGELQLPFEPVASDATR